MRNILALAAAMFFVGAATAQTTPAEPAARVSAKRGDVVFDVDKRRVGTVARVAKDGSIELIVGDRIVTLPVDKLSASGNTLSTTLTKVEVGHLR